MIPPASQIARRIRVPASFVLAGVYLIFSKPAPGLLALGAAVALLGLALRGASAGYLEKNRSLAKNGPYAYTRNPLYFGSALAGLGFCIAGGRWWFAILLVLFFLVLYWPVMRNEEAHLRTLFGNEFVTYARAVPLFCPGATPWRNGEQQRRFEWRRYRNNREYQAFVAFCVIVAALWCKMLWLP